MNRRRDLQPTIERKDGQLETATRHLAKAQAGERELKRQLREALKANQTLVRVLGDKEQLVASLTEAVDEITRRCDVLRADLAAARASTWWSRLYDRLEGLCR